MMKKKKRHPNDRPPEEAPDTAETIEEDITGTGFVEDSGMHKDVINRISKLKDNKTRLRLRKLLDEKFSFF